MFAWPGACTGYITLPKPTEFYKICPHPCWRRTLIDAAPGNEYTGRAAERLQERPCEAAGVLKMMGRRRGVPSAEEDE
jgi:hypothetical protein